MTTHEHMQKMYQPGRALRTEEGSVEFYALRAAELLHRESHDTEAVDGERIPVPTVMGAVMRLEQLTDVALDRAQSLTQLRESYDFVRTELFGLREKLREWIVNVDDGTDVDGALAHFELEPRAVTREHLLRVKITEAPSTPGEPDGRALAEQVQQLLQRYAAEHGQTVAVEDADAADDEAEGRDLSEYIAAQIRNGDGVDLSHIREP